MENLKSVVLVSAIAASLFSVQVSAISVSYEADKSDARFDGSDSMTMKASLSESIVNKEILDSLSSEKFGSISDDVNKGAVDKINVAETPEIKIDEFPDSDKFVDIVNEKDSLTAVPLPAAAWLLGSGVVGLMAMARRNNRRELLS